MRIAFLDTVLQYTTDTPYKSPLGGSQSALCYLAIELKRLGHAITIFNRLPGRNESAGIRIRHISEITVSGSLKTTLVPPSYVKLLDLTCPWWLLRRVQEPTSKFKSRFRCDRAAILCYGAGTLLRKLLLSAWY